LFVVHVLAPGPIGGLERVVQQLACGQHARGTRVEIVAVLGRHDDASMFLRPIETAGISVSLLRLAPRAYVAERRQLMALLQRRRPDLVHTHGYRSDVQGRAVAARLEIPAVTTVHGFTGGGWKNRLYERLQLNALRRFDAVVVVSEPLLTQLPRFGVPRERLYLIRNAAPIDDSPLSRSEARRRLGLPDHGFVAGWVGRLSVEKGPDVFLRALADLGDAGVIGVLVGAGRERERLADLAAHLDLGDRVVWPGVVPEAGRLFPAFDSFVLSSRTEGTPMVLFEAVAAGVPVVATAVGGVPQVVSSVEALLVPPEDPVALAAAIRAVQTEPASARERAQLALRRLEREHSPSAWLGRYDAVYQHVLSGEAPIA
jgi:glycosyltransferase involved in cell wall biosynthesis